MSMSPANTNSLNESLSKVSVAVVCSLSTGQRGIPSAWPVSTTMHRCGDFKSWPGGRGKGKRSDADWQRMKSAYGFASDEEALAYKHNPVDNLAPLAKAGIAILHVYGADDEVVPMEENSLVVEKTLQRTRRSFTQSPSPIAGTILTACLIRLPSSSLFLQHTQDN